MRNLITTLLLLVGLFPSAFSQGVEFRTVSVEQAREMAIKEGKPLFIDFYTSWCGPCKKMLNEVFTQKNVGDYFNTNFVCIKLNAEQAEGKTMARRYGVNAYPSFIVADTNLNVVYRTEGARPADEFIEKIKKGVDTRWSPQGLEKRYLGGERNPELVNEYALLQMESGNIAVGEKVVREYYNSLSSRKKAKAENFFLYERYARSYTDTMAKYMVAHQKDFVKNVGKERVESVMYNWIRQEIIPYISVKEIPTHPVTTESWTQLKEKIKKAGMEQYASLPYFLPIGDARMNANMEKYFQMCTSGFPHIESRDRFALLIGFNKLEQQSEEVKAMAVALISTYMGEAKGISKRVLQKMKLEIEGKREFHLRMTLETIEKGKVTVMAMHKGQFTRDTFAFDNHVVDIRLAGKDTLMASVQLTCKELENITAKNKSYYPVVHIINVPGEEAHLNVQAEKGKVPVVAWVNGDAISDDFYQLTYVGLQKEERDYLQLQMDNIIAGGDIRNYVTEFEAYRTALKDRETNFVRTHPHSYLSAYKLMERYTWFDENEIEALYNKFPETIKNTGYGKYIKNRLSHTAGCRVGSQAKDFQKKDMNGTTITLSDYKGKYVLLDFWGSWCGPCRASHAHLKELHAKYKEKLVFINIANENKPKLEQARKAWLKAIEEDGMTWTQILNNEDAEACDVLKLYAINSFPTKIIIDPQGKIVAKLVGSAVDLEEELKKLNIL